MDRCHRSYLIDGLALGPGYFGFTDPLTNTWKPKKFIAEGTTVNDGTVWSSGIQEIHYLDIKLQMDLMEILQLFVNADVWFNYTFDCP